MPEEPMLTVHARFRAHPGRRDELVQALLQMFPTAAGEDGTLVYAAHWDRDDVDAVIMYEVYRSDAALEAHGASQAAARFGAALDGLLAEEPQVWFGRPLQEVGLDLPSNATSGG